MASNRQEYRTGNSGSGEQRWRTPDHRRPQTEEAEFCSWHDQVSRPPSPRLRRTGPGLTLRRSVIQRPIRWTGGRSNRFSILLLKTLDPAWTAGFASTSGLLQSMVWLRGGEADPMLMMKLDRGNRSLADGSGSERSWPSASSNFDAFLRSPKRQRGSSSKFLS